MNPQRATDLSAVFPGDSEMARRMRAFAWERVDLGVPHNWPGNLRVALGMCLTSRVPMQLLWGRALTLLYNDASVPFVESSKRPAILGRSAPEAWGDAWTAIGPTADQVFADGEGRCLQDVPVFIGRDLPNEETYLTISLSPIFGDAGTVHGVFCICTETARVVSIQKQERRRIAREIHDQLGQEMTALRMTLELIRGRALFDPQLIAEAIKAERLAQNLDRSIDSLTSELWPASLDQLGLPAALANLLDDWSKRFDIPADFESPIVEELQLPRDAATNLYRIAQEALHNIIKHAKAKHAAVLLAKRKNEVILVIEDDGRGFDATAAHASPAHLGLISMRERAMLSGGMLEVDSVRGRGTTIFVRLPMSVASGDRPTTD